MARPVDRPVVNAEPVTPPKTRALPNGPRAFGKEAATAMTRRYGITMRMMGRKEEVDLDETVLRNFLRCHDAVGTDFADLGAALDKFVKITVKARRDHSLKDDQVIKSLAESLNIGHETIEDCIKAYHLKITELAKVYNLVLQ
jgi:hypothetical protein